MANNKKIIITAVVVLIGLLMYALSSSKPETDIITTIEATNTETGEREMLKLLTDMKTIRLDGKIFENEVYVNLQDFSRNVIEEPIGRQDPFAPLKDTAVNLSGGEDLSDQALLR